LRDELIKHHLKRIKEYIDLQNEVASFLKPISPNEQESFGLRQFVKKMTNKIQQLQFLENQLYVKAKIVNFNFESI
jgi:hypothetical protein